MVRIRGAVIVFLIDIERSEMRRIPQIGNRNGHIVPPLVGQGDMYRPIFIGDQSLGMEPPIIVLLVSQLQRCPRDGFAMVPIDDLEVVVGRGARVSNKAISVTWTGLNAKVSRYPPCFGKARTMYCPFSKGGNKTSVLWF